MSRSTSSIGSPLSDTIDGVNYFYSHTKLRTGICGQLSLNNNGLMFLSYTSQAVESLPDKSNNCSGPLSHFIPFNSHKSSNFEIDVLSIDHIKEGNDQNFVSLIVYCSDFRVIRFQIKNSHQTRRVVEKLRRLTATSSNTKYSKLTKALKDNYGYQLKNDWNRFERHWKECYKLRTTQSNENYLMCDSLPQTFIIPNQLTDQMLLSMISTQTRGQRVPVVSYLFPDNKNLLIRSSAFDNYEDLNGLLRDFVKPLRQIDIEAIFPSILIVEQSFEKLREVCLHSDKTDSNNCLSKIGKWINCVNITLKGVQTVVQIITNECSVGLVEDMDRDWNCLVSSLVQLMIDPKRRTFEGFESLISKEWLYLSGVVTRKNSVRNANHILFTLFLDCVSQLILQNPYAFEFSSLYLIYLFDCQYKQSSTPFFPSLRKASKTSLELEPKSVPLRQELSPNHMLLIHNPFYNRINRKRLEANTHISATELWSSLYLRWQSPPMGSSPTLDHLSSHETLYLNELQRKNLL